MRMLLALLLVCALAFPADHPMFSASNADAMSNTTAYTFRSINDYNTSTTAFRIYLTGDFDWFHPANFTYGFPPDGIQNNTLYWISPLSCLTRAWRSPSRSPERSDCLNP